MSTFPNTFGTAGLGTEKSYTPRSVLAGALGAMYLPQGKVIDGSKARDPLNTGDLDVLRNGMLLGKITTGGKFAPAIIGKTGVLHDTSVVTTVMTLPAAVVTEIQRRIGASGTFKITGGPTAGAAVVTEVVTYSAIASATTITITATAADFEAGSYIQPNDGSETILGILDEMVKVTDGDGTSQDTRMARLLIGGFIDYSQILNAPTVTASLLNAWLKAQLRAVGFAYVFDDDFGF